MKRSLVIFSLSVFLLLLGACERLRLHEENENVMEIAIEIPGMKATKGDVGDIPPASEDEYKLHSLKLWVYRNDTHGIIAYLNLAESDFPDPGSIGHYSVPISKTFAAEDPRPCVDVFAVANEAAAGLDGLNRDTSWDVLHELAFGGSAFGTDPLVRTPGADTGLPMSAMSIGMSVYGEKPDFWVEPVQLTRMVSKMRFVFCRMADDDVSISSVTVNGNIIPVTEHVFSMGGGLDIVTADGYVEEPFSVPGPDVIAMNESPEKLIYAGQDALTYETLINEAVSEGLLSDAGCVYLRESDKAISGYVNYTVGGQQKTRFFSNTAPGDFARNHSWLLYGYFISGRSLQLTMNVLPWDYNEYNISFREGLQATQFTLDKSTVEETAMGNDVYDEHLLSGVTAKGSLHITTPVGGKLFIEPVGDAWAFEVTPDVWDINPSYHEGRVDVSIRRNPDVEGDLTGKLITLSFHVEVGDRTIDADSEILNGNIYRFIL